MGWVGNLPLLKKNTKYYSWIFFFTLAMGFLFFRKKGLTHGTYPPIVNIPI
ncbi:MAG: hypothetical protein NTV68_05605 [Methanomicrobiales archaeon]|nr:hypothetical protein [Methanomicrobiales archaeon]